MGERAMNEGFEIANKICDALGLPETVVSFSLSYDFTRLDEFPIVEVRQLIRSGDELQQVLSSYELKKIACDETTTRAAATGQG